MIFSFFRKIDPSSLVGRVWTSSYANADKHTYLPMAGFP